MIGAGCVPYQINMITHGNTKSSEHIAVCSKLPETDTLVISEQSPAVIFGV